MIELSHISGAGCFKKAACFCIAIFLSVFCSFAYAQNNEKELTDNTIVIDECFFERRLTFGEIRTIYDSFDSYDYVRTKNQREELVRYLIRESERLRFNQGIARGSNILGVLYRDRAEYERAIDMHESAFELAGNDTIIVIYALNNLGVVYRRLNQHRIALDYHMQALEWAEQYNSEPAVASRSICIALNSIGNINLAMNQPEQALKVFNETLSMELDNDNKLGLAINYHNIGYAHEALEQLDIARSYYDKSLQYNNMIDSDLGRSICYNSIGEIYLKEESVDMALENFELSMKFAKLTNDDYYVAQAHANIGKAYLHIKNYESALPELMKYKAIAERLGSLNLLQDSYRILSLYYEETDEFDNALAFHKKAVAYNDSIINEKNSRYLNEVQFLYEADKKEQKIELLTIENRAKTQQNLIILLGSLFVFLVGVVLYVLHKRKTDKQRIQLESKLFRSLMNPHFIFNALASIQSFLYKNEPQKAAGYLGNFSKLTRSILKNASKDLVTLEEEIETLRNYLEIEQMRLRECFKFKISIDDNVETDFIYILPTMLQPFVENSIHHGLKNMNCNNGYIELKIKDYNNYFRITISDNGCGINNPLGNSGGVNHKSMGLKIFKERIKLIERKYKKTVKFAIVDLSEIHKNRSGTMVSIDFPHINPDDKSINS